ncbi:YsnF/AvaK domain-containing protein [Falsirhodobacter deserti]|uniref:YsnF/AvaK domain-containing protein n=1 Tax=Falsirhodobacter deserti TaxID=1365611 RepID=UPI000FE2A4F4|nr:YsnF/AvaK domain-containing protein [Falsirhodobacter deserti]
MTYNSDIGTSASGTTSVSALFDSRADAESAARRLREIGISDAQIRMVEGSTGTTGTTTTGTADADRNKGFWDTLSDYLLPDEDRYSYAEGLSRGSHLITVTGVDAANYDRVLDVLDDEGTVNLDEREASWRAEGWGGYDAGTRGRAAADTSEDASIPVVEERLHVGKRDTSHGRVRVRAYTVSEPVSESVELRDERVELERRPVDREVTSADGAFRDRTLEAEEHREEAVVVKDARVVEEVGLRKTTDTHRETVSDTVRHTEVEVEDDRDTRDGTARPIR